MGETSLAKEYLIKGEKEGANIDTKKGTVSLGEKELFKRTETQNKLMEQQEKQTLAKEKTVIEKVGGGTGEFEASKILSAMKDKNFDNTGKMEVSIDGNNYQIWNNSETIVRLQCYMISQGANIGTYKSGEKMIDGDFGNSSKNGLKGMNLETTTNTEVVEELTEEKFFEKIKENAGKFIDEIIPKAYKVTFPGKEFDKSKKDYTCDLIYPSMNNPKIHIYIDSDLTKTIRIGSITNWEKEGEGVKYKTGNRGLISINYKNVSDPYPYPDIDLSNHSKIKYIDSSDFYMTNRALDGMGWKNYFSQDGFANKEPYTKQDYMKARLKYWDDLLNM